MAATRYFAFRATVEQLGDREIIVRASDETPGRDGLVLLTAGAVLSNFRRNPVVLRDHSMAMPVGRCTDIRVSGNELIARVEFAPLGVSADADQTCALAKAGTLNAVSCGFDIIKIGPPQNGVRTVSEWELLELSIVAVPALASAVILQRAKRSTGDSRAEVLLSTARDHLRLARDHCDVVRDSLRRGDLDAAGPPHPRLLDDLRGTSGALDEAATKELPAPGRTSDRRLADARRHIAAAGAAHKSLGGALDRGRLTDCREAHRRLDAGIRGCRVAVDDLLGKSPVDDAGSLGALADPAHQGTSATLADQLNPQSKTFAYSAFGQRQADLARLRGGGASYRSSDHGGFAIWQTNRAAEHARAVGLAACRPPVVVYGEDDAHFAARRSSEIAQRTLAVSSAISAFGGGDALSFEQRQADKARILRTVVCPQSAAHALSKLFR